MSLEVNSVWRFEGVEGFEDSQYRLLKIYADCNAAVVFQLVEAKKLVRPRVIRLGLLDLLIHPR